MPKMKEVKKSARFRRYTDHRALVLEVVATTPHTATRDAVQKEVASLSNDFHTNAISAMVSELLRVGMLGRKEDGSLFITTVGLETLTQSSFDRALPEPYEKPTRRKKKA